MMFREGVVPLNRNAPPERVRLGACPEAGPVPFTVSELRIIGAAISWMATMASASGMGVPGVAKKVIAVVGLLTGGVGLVLQLMPSLQFEVPVVVLVQVCARALVESPMRVRLIRLRL